MTLDDTANNCRRYSVVYAAYDVAINSKTSKLHAGYAKAANYWANKLHCIPIEVTPKLKST